MPVFQLDGKDIYYQIREVDNKNALIFIHGSAGSSECWKNQLNLDIDYNLIAIDLPSHAKSDNFSELSIDLYVIFSSIASMKKITLILYIDLPLTYYNILIDING